MCVYACVHLCVEHVGLHVYLCEQVCVPTSHVRVCERHVFAILHVPTGHAYVPCICKPACVHLFCAQVPTRRCVQLGAHAQKLVV